MPIQPLPQGTFPWVDSQGKPTQQFLKAMVLFFAGNIGPLTSAANDTAASKAGVAVGGLYQNNGVVMIRQK
jgi:hypothetical protein